MEAHPYAELFSMDESTIPELAERIRVNGQHDPIVIFEGKILDGRRRFAACQSIGVDPKTRNFNTKTECHPLEFVLDKNIHRRQDDFESRCRVAERLLIMKPVFTDRDVASRCNISHPKVAQIRTMLVEEGRIEQTNTRIDTLGREFIVPPKKPAAPPEEVDGDLAGDQLLPPVKAPRPKPTPVMDANELNVPPHLADTFSDTFYAEAMEAVHAMRNRVNRNPKLYKRLLVNEAFANLTESLIQCLRNNSPHSCCLQCLGSGNVDGGQGCPQCYTLGWVSIGQHEQYLYNSDNEP